MLMHSVIYSFHNSVPAKSLVFFYYCFFKAEIRIERLNVVPAMTEIWLRQNNINNKHTSALKNPTTKTKKITGIDNSHTVLSIIKYCT